MTTFILRTPKGKRPFMAYDSEARARDDKARAEKVMRGPLELVRIDTHVTETVLH